MRSRPSGRGRRAVAVIAAAAGWVTAAASCVAAAAGVAPAIGPRAAGVTGPAMELPVPTPAGPTLVGFARHEALTFAEGPSSGHFVAPANGVLPPFIDRQPVQGISSVIAGPRAATFLALADNGFGVRENSPDFVLRVYALRPDFRSAAGGGGTVEPVDIGDGAARPDFDARSRIDFSDPGRRLGYPAVADREFYPWSGTGPGRADVPVDPQLRRGRLLTGADLDVEALVRDPRGDFWVGDEFGPFLLRFDARGRLREPPIPVPTPPAAPAREFAAATAAPLRSPQHPEPGGVPATVRASNGLEALAIDGTGNTLLAMLETAPIGAADPKAVPILEYDLANRRWSGRVHWYRFDAAGTNIGELTAYDAHRYLVIERDGTQGDPRRPAEFPAPARHKKLYLVDLRDLHADGTLRKRLLVDLLDVADPDDLDRDGDARYTMPFVTIESVAVVDPRTFLVVNDNNFPGSGGRTTTAPEATEFALIRLPAAP